MTANIEGILNTPGPNREGRAKTATSKQSRLKDDTAGRQPAAEEAHTVELSPEAVSRAQKMVTGSGYITAGDPGDVDLSEEQALELAAELGRQIETLTAGLSPQARTQLAGMIG